MNHLSLIKRTKDCANFCEKFSSAYFRWAKFLARLNFYSCAGVALFGATLINVIRPRCLLPPIYEMTLDFVIGAALVYFWMRYLFMSKSFQKVASVYDIAFSYQRLKWDFEVYSTMLLTNPDNEFEWRLISMMINKSTDKLAELTKNDSLVPKPKYFKIKRHVDKDYFYRHVI
jgi:hypothetical protein